jgi:hypothetical protein
MDNQQHFAVSRPESPWVVLLVRHFQRRSSLFYGLRQHLILRDCCKSVFTLLFRAICSFQMYLDFVMFFPLRLFWNYRNLGVLGWAKTNFPNRYQNFELLLSICTRIFNFFLILVMKTFLVSSSLYFLQDISIFCSKFPYWRVFKHQVPDFAGYLQH